MLNDFHCLPVGSDRAGPSIEDDAITHATAGLNLYAPNAPARLSIDFTHRIEQSGRTLDNDGLEVAAQVRF